MAPSDPSWNFQDPASKQRVLNVLQAEMDSMFDLVADPARWEAPTACENWEARDVVGHLVDTTEGYLPAFAGAHSNATAEEPLGLRDMATHVDQGAKSLRKVPREELIGRLRDDSERMMEDFTALSADDWAGFMVPHKYMGPLPAMFYPMFQIVDYAVHGWDIREGMRTPHAMSGDAADLLVPVIFVLWSATADVSAVDRPCSVGVRTTGHNGGDMRADVSSEGVQFSPGNIDDCEAVLEFDPATLVLTGYARMNGGTARGDEELAGKFRELFFPI
jgi:uncharacterized protein (TIGR03083 family)